MPLDHKTGCPAQRIDQYQATSPEGIVHNITRCADCGAHETAPVRQGGTK